MNCPNCGGGSIRRSRLRWSDTAFLVFLLLRPYRCRECYARFFRSVVRRRPRSLHEGVSP
ncbi:MAG: hypothetical protein HY000_32680 [Planctomycetes bacterium]|nr:hypothetical protein [Planctomycetota bacterium]